MSTDIFSGSYETTQGRVYTLSGGDWDTVLGSTAGERERIVVNMGPQHPSTHGVLRLILELDGETVTEARCGIGYLHTGIEKNMEYRSWVQGTTYVTRMDYLSPIFNETAYCLAVEKMLGITDQIPDRANTIRVLLMELNRVSSHLVALATGGMELGALTAMTNGFRDRELILDLFEMITGLRMNMAYVRPFNILVDNPIWTRRTKNIGVLDLTGCMALGITGPVLRSTGLPWDLRKTQPYCGYENYEFNVVTENTSDTYGRFLIRMREMHESLNIVEQALTRLKPGPVMVEDKSIAWPAQLALGSDGLGNSLDHIRKIMGQSMESLIHHFKLVTEGFKVPAGQAYVAIESPRGELGALVISDGGTKPYRVHFRDPSFNNLQAVGPMGEGGQVADLVAAVASIDPVMGGVDR